MPDTSWRPDRSKPASRWPMPSLGTTLARGFACKCPSCGKAPIFAGYLTVVRACANCGAPLGAARADDAPPYFTILVVGHIVVGLMLWSQRAFDPSTLTMTLIFVPLTIVLSLLLLRPIKGATVGLMLRFNMIKPEDELPPEPAPVVVPITVRPAPGTPAHPR